MAEKVASAPFPRESNRWQIKRKSMTTPADMPLTMKRKIINYFSNGCKKVANLTGNFKLVGQIFNHTIGNVILQRHLCD